MRRAGILLCLALLAGCGRLPPAQPAAGPVPAAAAERGAGLTASCRDPGRDLPGIHLLRTRLVEDASGLEVVFRLAATPPQPDARSLELSVSIWTPQGVPVRELAVHWSTADPDAYVYDMSSSTAVQVPTHPTITATTEAVQFPRSALRGLTGPWEWDAWASQGTHPVDDCPRSQGGVPPRVASPGEH